jgi:hypothetical protein
MTNFEAAFVGCMLGILAASVSSLFMFLARSARIVRNMLAIGTGYVLIGSSAIGSLILLLSITNRLGIARKSSQREFALYAYTIPYAVISFLTIRAELKWRKSIRPQYPATYV